MESKNERWLKCQIQSLTENNARLRGEIDRLRGEMYLLRDENDRLKTVNIEMAKKVHRGKGVRLEHGYNMTEEANQYFPRGN